MYCSKCGMQMPDGSKFCIYCGHKMLVDTASHSMETDKANTFIESINEYVGNQNPVSLNWKDLFRGVLKKHSHDEAETIFICGTKSTTPVLSEVSSTWPNPWLYARVFSIQVVVFFLLSICWNVFQNTNVLPGLIAVGAFTVPLTTLILFFEVNAYRNISFYLILLMFLVGGCASLVATLFLYAAFPVDEMNLWGACVTGFVEEVGKALIVYIFIKRLPTCHYVLNGLLIGASVGAGFAAFESAGYAFNALANSGDVSQMMTSIYLRGFLAPGGHVAWAAISGAAITLVKGNRTLSIDMLFSQKFLKIFLIPVALHIFWDMPLFGSFMKLMALTVFIWIIVLIFINMGLDEVKRVTKAEIK